MYRTQEVSVDGNDSLDVEVGVTLNNTVIYNAMIHPLTRMVIRGVIWYQGNYMIKDVKKNMTV